MKPREDFVVYVLCLWETEINKWPSTAEAADTSKSTHMFAHVILRVFVSGGNERTETVKYEADISKYNNFIACGSSVNQSCSCQPPDQKLPINRFVVGSFADGSDSGLCRAAGGHQVSLCVFPSWLLSGCCAKRFTVL